MATPFLAEIKIVSFNFAPKGWAMCNGQLMPISQNQALFSILGTTYGGNGQTTFALPDLRGRVPVYQGQGINLGQAGGQEAHTISIAEMPTHMHQMNALAGTGGAQNVNVPTGNYLNNSAPNELYNSGAGAQLVAMNPATISNTGASQAHENRQPFLVLNFCIALQGIFPSRN
jgi:microcystin-dependent protein